MRLPLVLYCEEKKVETNALLDSGAGGTFIDQNFTQTLRMHWQKLPNPITALNVDGMINKKGTITHSVKIPIKIGETIKQINFKIAGIGKQKVILGFDWLQKENLTIDWKNGHLTFPTSKLR